MTAPLRPVGLILPMRSGKAECFTARVHELEVPPDVRTEVEPMLALLSPLNDTLHALDAQLATMAQLVGSRATSTLPLDQSLC